jgi:hypothetical protein
MSIYQHRYATRKSHRDCRFLLSELRVMLEKSWKNEKHPRIDERIAGVQNWAIRWADKNFGALCSFSPVRCCANQREIEKKIASPPLPVYPAGR